MTLVFSTETGRLVQAQLGAIDVVATFSAVRAVYGCLGGIDGARFLLSRIPNPFHNKIRQLKLDQRLELLPFRGHVFTGHGHLIGQLDDAKESFGGDIRTQVIGTTVCALAHECDPLTAAQLFCDFLLPFYFGCSDPLTSAVRQQVMEKGNLRQIINEGASRGLNDKFIKVLSDLNLPAGDRRWLYEMERRQARDGLYIGEINLLAGLLKWLTREERLGYRTRSGAVARIAACLKSVGYPIGPIEIWDGYGEPPPLQEKMLTLVMGGSSETDQLAEEDPQLPNTEMVFHYTFNTVGSVLLDSMRSVINVRPEVLQEDFEQSFAYVQEHVTVQFLVDRVLVMAKFSWQECERKPSALSIRLASIYFPLVAEFVAPCYERVASESYLDRIKAHLNGSITPERRELARFRGVTVAIMIAIAGRLAPRTFTTTRHCIALNLYDDLWLSETCRFFDRSVAPTAGMEFGLAVILLAKIHCAQEPENMKSLGARSGGNRVAWRNGIYGIVPSLLFDMSANKAECELVCID